MAPERIGEFAPPPRLLLGPGPSLVHPRVLRAGVTLHRRCGDVPRGPAARSGSVGHRYLLQRDPEMPELSTRPGPRDPQRPGIGCHQEPQDSLPEPVPGPVAGGGLLGGGQAGLPPYRADLDALRVAGSVAPDRRRRTGGPLCATPRQQRGPDVRVARARPGPLRTGRAPAPEPARRRLAGSHRRRPGEDRTAAAVRHRDRRGARRPSRKNLAHRADGRVLAQEPRADSIERAGGHLPAPALARPARRGPGSRGAGLYDTSHHSSPITCFDKGNERP